MQTIDSYYFRKGSFLGFSLFSFIIAMVILSFFVSSCCKDYPDHYYNDGIARYNLFGFTGMDSTDPYLEIEYSQAIEGSLGNNEVIKKLVRPPHLIGDHDVYFSYALRTIAPCSNSITDAPRYLDFSPGGNSYLKVINHSSQPVKMFVAETSILNLSYSNHHRVPVVFYCPFPIYKSAPIYYLMFPEKSPSLDLYFLYKDIELNSEGGSDADFTLEPYNKVPMYPHQLGDVSISTAWDVEKVMKLYEDEHSQTSNLDNALYLSYGKATNSNYSSYMPYFLLTFSTNPRLSLISQTNWYKKELQRSLSFNYTHLRPIRYYIEIAAKDTFVANKEWMIIGANERNIDKGFGLQPDGSYRHLGRSYPKTISK